MNNTSVPPQGEQYLYDDAAAGAGGPPVSIGVWLKAAWRRKWLMLLLLLLVLGGGVLFTYLQKPVYNATALLSFSERSAGAFRSEGGERVTENFVNAQISLMTRDATLGEIARDPDLALSKAAMFRSEPDLIQALKDRIKILLLKDTTILSVDVQGQDPRLITAIANKVADFQRASVEDSRDASTRGAVLEYVKKMADMSSEMSAINQKIWTRANSAHIPGLTFNEQQKDSRVIVAAFQRQSATLLAQRADTRKQLDQSTADLASAENQFEAECGSLLREIAPEPMQAAAIEALPKPTSAEKPAAAPLAISAAPAQTSGSAAATTAVDVLAATAPAKPADKPSEPAAAKIPVVTAAQFAALYQELLKVEAEAEKASPSAPEPATGNPQAPELAKKRAEIITRIEALRRLFQLQSQSAQDTFQGQAAAQEKVAKQAERISQIEDELEARKLSLTPENYSQDFTVKALQERKATLEAQLETDRAKLNADLASMAKRMEIVPRMMEEAQKIQQLEKSAVALRALRMSRKIYRENYDAIQAALDALTGPLNDILNESEKYTRIEEAYLKMDEWVRDVKLALSQITVTVYEATEPTVPIRPKWPINIALSGLLGMMASFGAVMLLEFSRKTVKTPGDAQRNLGAAVLGVVPHFRGLDFGDEVFSLDALKDPHVVEAFNEVRFYIHAATDGRPPRSILVTSAAAREGKTTVSTLLAHSLARSGEKVLLVDANLRLPYLHLVFQCESRPGLADILNDDAAVPCIRPTGIENLYIMTAGAAGEDGLAWVQPERFAQFVRAAGELFDHVIFDSTSTIGVADVRIMASGVDAVIYVVQADRHNGALVSRGIENIRHARANLIGVVLNNAKYTKGDHYYFRKRALDSSGAGAEAKKAADKEPAETSDEGNGKE
jgi:capsular exopolysaccharide synthesis family protein